MKEKIINFPTIITDNFFANANNIVKYANSLEYIENNDNYPGCRSAYLHEINHDLFKYCVLKVLNTYYPDADIVCNNAIAQFQKISNIYEDGWVHQDNALITFIIYLNDTNTIDSGTSLYTPKNKNILSYIDKKKESFKYPDKVKKYEQYRKLNNNQFIETLKVNNIFNRCLAFNSSTYHKANGFNIIDNRLTLIGFIYDFNYSYK